MDRQHAVGVHERPDKEIREYHYEQQAERPYRKGDPVGHANHLGDLVRTPLADIDGYYRDQRLGYCIGRYQRDIDELEGIRVRHQSDGSAAPVDDGVLRDHQQRSDDHLQCARNADHTDVLENRLFETESAEDHPDIGPSGKVVPEPQGGHDHIRYACSPCGTGQAQIEYVDQHGIQHYVDKSGDDGDEQTERAVPFGPQDPGPYGVHHQEERHQQVGMQILEAHGDVSISSYEPHDRFPQEPEHETACRGHPQDQNDGGGNDLLCRTAVSGTDVPGDRCGSSDGYACTEGDDHRVDAARHGDGGQCIGTEAGAPDAVDEGLQILHQDGEHERH